MPAALLKQIFKQGCFRLTEKFPVATGCDDVALGMYNGQMQTNNRAVNFETDLNTDAMKNNKLPLTRQ